MPRFYRSKGVPEYRLAYLFFLSVALWLLFNWLRGIIWSSLLETEIAEFGVLEKSISVDGLLIRQETLVTTPVKGRLRPLVEEGQRVRVGAAIAEVLPGSEGVRTAESYVLTASRAGVVSYYYDGLETVLSPEMLNELDLDKLATFMETAQTSTSFSNPAVRIVDNHKPLYLYFQINPEKLFEVEIGNTLSLYLPGKEEAVKAEVVRLEKEAEHTTVLVRLPYQDHLLNQRHISFRLVTDSYRGIIVERSLLVFKEGKAGIYVMKAGRIYWQPVKVLGEVGEKVAIDGIEEGSELLTGPLTNLLETLRINP
ncbi:HlyD family efflux transporter periplasmic adaptor subunit [Calderihabitans maritimus]|uniref:RND related barrel-sandwich hybrid domain-containing protein n=1 Tax=Calderihabitans maritimus TaxID=1246530 RepID=A0A1Z5HTE9_9FIRM|nr:HlyD family efflux transporter periplasmic adaptor subunit [Calderihabitans maritimus]GAW92585.1 hypothetical protein Desca_2294 [Calderihabitans maritimus]